MDPNATLKQLCDQLEEQDGDGAQESIEALQSWLNAGGFMPDISPSTLAFLLSFIQTA